MANDSLTHCETSLHEAEEQVQQLRQEREQLLALLHEKEELLQALQCELDQLKNTPTSDSTQSPPLEKATAPQAQEEKPKDIPIPSGQSTSKKRWIPKILNQVGGSWRAQTSSIGVDMEDDGLTFIQVKRNTEGLELTQAIQIPDIEENSIDSPQWGNWAIQTMRMVMQNHDFKTRKIALAMPVRETYIDHLAIPATTQQNIEKAIFDILGNKLPYRATFENTIIKHVRPTQEHVVAIALERQRVDSFIRMCEQARLDPELLSIWPMAMVNTCNVLHPQPGNTFVMLIDMAMTFTNVVIFSNSTLYYARTIPIGVRDLRQENLLNLLVGQILNCRSHFSALYKQQPIDRTLYFANQVADHDTIQLVAKRTAIPSQLANPFGVLKTSSNRGNLNTGEEEKNLGWSVALGLSLSSFA